MSLNSVSNSSLFKNAVVAVVESSSTTFNTIQATTIDCQGLNSNDVAATGEVLASLYANNASAPQTTVGFTFNNNVQSIAPAPASSFAGMQIGWNMDGNVGETDLINLSQADTNSGGFDFYNASQTNPGVQLASLRKGTGLTLTANAPNLDVFGTINEVNIGISGNNTVTLSPLVDSAGTAPLAFNVATNEVTFNTSTIRAKQDVTDMIGTESIYNLRPVRYKEKRSGLVQFGFIAEEAYQANPMYIWRDREGFVGGLNDKAIIASLIAELKALRFRVDQLDPSHALPVMSPPLVQVLCECDIPEGINPPAPAVPQCYPYRLG